MTARGIAAYYSLVGAQYARYSGRARGWHWGVWDPDVRDHQQALIRSNELLAAGLGLSPRSRVLDVGCGVGGFAIWVAKTFGCQITGITICARHVPLARKNAKRAGVGGLCEFFRMDMDRLRFSDVRFDLVVNQESFCYATDKRDYLASVFDILAPGGAWRCIDTYRSTGVRSSPAVRRLRDAVSEGFRIASYPSTEEVVSFLRRAGFVSVAAVDLTRRVLPNRERMEPLSFALASLFPQWCFSGSRRARIYRGGNYRAGSAVMEAFGRGYMKHVLHRARRPAESGERAIASARRA